MSHRQRQHAVGEGPTGLDLLAGLDDGRLPMPWAGAVVLDATTGAFVTDVQVRGGSRVFAEALVPRPGGFALVGVGAVAVAAGTYLYLRSGKPAARTATAWLDPRGGGGVGYAGTF